MKLTRIVATAGVLCLLSSTSDRAAQPVQRRAVSTTSAADRALRQRFLTMFARGYVPGRSGQIMIVPREDAIITRNSPDLRFMHGSPWSRDIAIPLLLHGPGVRPGRYVNPARQQDVAPTIAALLGTTMPTSAVGRVVREALTPAARRAVVLFVLDGMRVDYFDTYRAQMPTLTRLKAEGAWFSAMRIDYLPSNTAIGHTTIATGAYPAVHGITGNSMYDAVKHQRQASYVEYSPRDLMALTIADVWNAATAGRAVIVAQGSSPTSAIPLAGHGACIFGGRPVRNATYSLTSGAWETNPACFTLPEYLVGRNSRTLWETNEQMKNSEMANPDRIRRTTLFPTFEGDALVSLIEREPFGEDDVSDLLLVNIKGADHVGHRVGPRGAEMMTNMAEVDREVARALEALDRKLGPGGYTLVLTADHGMPAEPRNPAMRVFAEDIVKAIHDRFDPEKKLVGNYDSENSQIALDPDRVRELKLDLRAVAGWLSTQPYVFAAYTEDEVRRAVP